MSISTLKMFLQSGILAFFLIAGVYSSTFPTENDIGDETSFLPKSFSKCADSGGLLGMVNCAAVRTVKSLQHLSRQNVLEIIPGISLNSDTTSQQREGKEINDVDLPQNPQEKANRLFELLIENAGKLISGRTLKIKIPDNVAENMSRALQEEGRKRRKGGKFPSFMLGLGAKMMSMMPGVVAALGLLSAKALIVAKLALLLSVIVFIQSFASKASNLFSGIGNYAGHSLSTGFGGGSYGSYGPPSFTTNNLGGQYPYARSIDVAQDTAQDLAYSKSKQN